MADLLTERAKFFCVAAPAVTFTISISGSVTHKGAKVLTTAAKLSGNGICPILTALAQGTPQPCKFQQTPWINFALTQTADSKNLLTANSFCNCLVGSVVKVQSANAQNFRQI